MAYGGSGQRSGAAFQDFADISSTASFGKSYTSPASSSDRPDCPTLLGRDLGPALTPSVIVKNTFIDGFEDEEQEGEDIDGDPMFAVKSCPVFHLKSPAGNAGPRGGMLRSLVEETAEELGPPMPAYGGSVPTLEQQRYLQQQYQDQFLVQGMQQQPPKMQPPQAAPVIIPLELRQPEMSVGSELHGTGECRPCAWFWRPQGCMNSAECRHCHLCPAGEMKARRKQKAQASRAGGSAAPNTEDAEAMQSFPGFAPIVGHRLTL
mmetsp:Transcript_3499/g.10208  ORF Transcript_3499/g.10208 Transcript_3499/m.10208 type:complete len:263 (-) Transcript_3499:94-882(-)